MCDHMTSHEMCLIRRRSNCKNNYKLLNLFITMMIMRITQKCISECSHTHTHTHTHYTHTFAMSIVDFTKNNMVAHIRYDIAIGVPYIAALLMRGSHQNYSQ